MNRDSFACWMNNTMNEYRRKQIPFLGYLWIDSRQNKEGGALYRLDKTTFDGQLKKSEIKEIHKAISKLQREDKQIFIYQG